MFNEEQLAVINYCAQECSRQMSGERSVYDMVNAWNSAQDVKSHFTVRDITESDGKITLPFITHLGWLVEPEVNMKGFRKHPIGISDGWAVRDIGSNWPSDGFNVRNIGSNWPSIEEHLTMLLESYYEGRLDEVNGYREHLVKRPEDEFYFQYETIHPFGDGNGRTGKILYNYLCGTLDNPIMPPDFFGSSNP